jgi:hypothetical protein
MHLESLIIHFQFEIDELRDGFRGQEVRHGHLYDLQRNSCIMPLNSPCSLFIGKLNEPETQSGRASDIHNCPIGNIRKDHQNYRAERFQGRCKTFRPLSITAFAIEQCIRRRTGSNGIFVSV